MSKIKIKNFGPIKDGLDENNGFIDIKQITIFIGNQATGKSTIVKIFSTLAWLEKSIYQETLSENDIVRYNRFINKFCAYQGLKNYFQEDTYLEYIGDSYTFKYSNQELEIKKLNNEYLVPQIMYVPAERNFLSILEDSKKQKGLPSSLYTFLEEFEKSKREIKGEIELPINNLSFEFQKQNKISYIKGKDYKIRLSEASSGIQSLLPVYLVSKFLADSINQEKDNSKKSLSIEESQKLKLKIIEILSNDKLSKEIKESALELLSSAFNNACFINIVEELEQNLFPQSQKKLLYSLLAFVNKTKGNRLLLTTHSPYIINYLTLSIKGTMVLEKISNNRDIKDRFEKIIPSNSCIDGKNVTVYELTDNGGIRILDSYKNLPSDENFLNLFLEETNDEYSKLLDIEDELI